MWTMECIASICNFWALFLFLLGTGCRGLFQKLPFSEKKNCAMMTHTKSNIIPVPILKQITSAAQE